ncbi:peptidylprolyl isomerase [Coprobacter sp.]
MATLQKIRGKAGLLVGVIGVALLAFIVGDLLNSGHTFFNMNRNKIAVVNGKTITPEDFQAQVQTRTEEMQNMYRRQYGMSLPEGAASRINKEVYDQMVQEILLADATSEIGLSVSSEELADLLQGDNIVPMVKQQFVDPQTGVFSKDLLLNFLQMILDDDNSKYEGEMGQQIMRQREAWLNLEKTVKQQQLIGKYFALLSKSMAPNKLDLEAAYDGSKNSVDFAYAEQPYSSIADSTVVISESELKDLYNKEKKNFKQDEKREIKFFAVDIIPSQADYKMTEEKINNLKENFSTTKDIAGMLSFNTDVPYVDAYVAQRDMDPEMRKFAETAQIDEVYGPVFENESYKMYRLIGKSVAPDSVKVRHIMFPLQADAKIKAQMDSVLNVLKNGGDFEALAKQFSVDQNSAMNGGDLGWLTETAAVQFGQKFVSSSFNGGSGYFTVETPYGQHIVQVTERTASIPKAKVAQLVLNVRPSSETYSTLYNKVSSYIAENGKLESFEKNAKDKGFSLNTVELTPDDISVGMLNDGREIVKWAYKSDKGDISEIFNIENKFLVAALTDLTPAGYAPLKNVESYLKMKLMADKKADMIMKTLAEKAPKSLDTYASAMSSKIDTAKFVTFNTAVITGIGREPALCGLAPYASVNQLQGPVKGNNGVYVFSVTKKDESSVPMNAEMEKQKYEQMMYSLLSSQVMEVMKEKADIENNRVRFF